MGRSQAFFAQIDDLTLLSMLVQRIAAVQKDKIDAEELLEKAEIRFLELVGYEASHSDERLTHLMVALDDSANDTINSLA